MHIPRFTGKSLQGFIGNPDGFLKGVVAGAVEQFNTGGITQHQGEPAADKVAARIGAALGNRLFRTLNGSSSRPGYLQSQPMQPGPGWQASNFSPPSRAPHGAYGFRPNGGAPRPFTTQAHPAPSAAPAMDPIVRQNVQTMNESWQHARAAGDGAIQAFETGDMPRFLASLDACASAMQAHEGAMSGVNVDDLISAQDRADEINLSAMSKEVERMTPGQAEGKLALLREQIRPAWDEMKAGFDAMHRGDSFGSDRQAISDALERGGRLAVMIREMELLQERMAGATQAHPAHSAPAMDPIVRENVQTMNDTWQYARAVGEGAMQAFEAGDMPRFQQNFQTYASVMQVHADAMSKVNIDDLISAQNGRDEISLSAVSRDVKRMTPGQAEGKLALLLEQIRPAWDEMKAGFDAMHRGDSFGSDRQAISEALERGGRLAVMIREMELLQERMAGATQAPPAPPPTPAMDPGLRKNVQYMEHTWREAEAMGNEIIQALVDKDVPRSQKSLETYISAMRVHADSMSKVGIDDLLSAQNEVDQAKFSAMSRGVERMNLNQAWGRVVQLSKELPLAWHAVTVGFNKMHDTESFGSDRQAISEALMLRGKLIGMYDELQLLQKRLAEMMQSPPAAPPAPAMDPMRAIEIPVS